MGGTQGGVLLCYGGALGANMGVTSMSADSDAIRGPSLLRRYPQNRLDVPSINLTLFPTAGHF